MRFINLKNLWNKKKKKPEKKKKKKALTFQNAIRLLILRQKVLNRFEKQNILKSCMSNHVNQSNHILFVLSERNY